MRKAREPPGGAVRLRSGPSTPRRLVLQRATTPTGARGERRPRRVPTADEKKTAAAALRSPLSTFWTLQMRRGLRSPSRYPTPYLQQKKADADFLKESSESGSELLTSTTREKVGIASRKSIRARAFQIASKATPLTHSFSSTFLATNLASFCSVYDEDGLCSLFDGGGCQRWRSQRSDRTHTGPDESRPRAKERQGPEQRVSCAHGSVLWERADFFALD